MFGDPVSNEKGLPIRILSEWVDAGRPITYGILKPGPDVSDGIAYVRVADMKGGGINVAGVRRTSRAIANEYRRSTLNAGDLLMSIRGHVGRFAHIPDELDGANITQDSARLAIGDHVESLYVRAAMEMPSFQHWMARHTKGAAVRGINLGDLRTAPLPDPPPSMKVEFARAIESLRTASLRVRAEATADDELFASLQSRAFRGEL